MDWEQLKLEVEDTVGKRLDLLQNGLEVQRSRLLETIARIQGFADTLKTRVSNGKSAKEEDKEQSRPQTSRPHLTKLPAKPSSTVDVKKNRLVDEDKKSSDDGAKNKLEEGKKKKIEELKKKKEEDDAKKKEALQKKEEEEAKKKENLMKKKEEDEAKKKEALLKKKEDDERKKEESKKKQEEAKEKKKQEELEKKAKIEESKKKAEEKKKLEADKKDPKEVKTEVKDEAKEVKSELNEAKTDAKEEKTDVKEPINDISDSKILLKQNSLKIDKQKFDSSLDQISDISIKPDSFPSEKPNLSFKSEEKPPASLVPQQTLEEITIQIQNLKTACSEEELNFEKSFELSVGAKSALSLLTTMDDDKFYLDRMPRPEVVWTFRLFFTLLNSPLPDKDEEAWAVCQEFLLDARNKEKNKKTIDKVIVEKISKFDFSNENIDKLEFLIFGKDNLLQPQYYTEFCALTGLLMFAVREAALFGGAIKGKIPIWRQYRRLLHKQEQLENKLLS